MMLATCHLKRQTEPLANRLLSGEMHILLPSTHTNQGNVAAIGGLSFHMGTMRLKTLLKLSMVARDPRLGPSSSLYNEENNVQNFSCLPIWSPREEGCTECNTLGSLEGLSLLQPGESTHVA